jgi:hypothetical protein
MIPSSKCDYNILKSTESFFTRINLHIIQCDAAIQEDFDEYLKTMKIHGLGCTDFRPVFEYVEALRKDEEFIAMDGNIWVSVSNKEMQNSQYQCSCRGSCSNVQEKLASLIFFQKFYLLF